MDDESQHLMNRAGIIEKFNELDDKYKTDSSPDGIQNVLNIYGINQTSDLVPSRIYDIYKEDWKKYCTLMKNWDIIDDDDDSMTSSDIEDINERFSRFQETIFHSNQTIMSFMRMTNCNSAFPVPLTPDFLFWHSPISKGAEMKPIHILTIYLLGSIFQQRYRRCKNIVMEQVFTPGGFPTHSWKEKCTIGFLIRELCDKESRFQMWQILTSGLFESVEKYLTNCQDMEFPDLVVKRRVWSFQDGIYDASDDKFLFYGKHTDTNLVSCKMIDLPFGDSYYNDALHLPSSPRKTYDEIETPLFESIFEPQEWDSDMIKWIFVFIGRLFYNVNEKDGWQVVPFLLGTAGTGKSTIIKIIQMMYDPRDVGIISNNIEKKFGLSGIFEKMVFLIPELKKDFALDQAEFQSVVTGEEISLPRKHDVPIVGTWTVPGFMCGNELAGWEDKSGSICRRIILMDFPNKLAPEKIDPNLLSKIKKNELPSIIRKSALAYKWALERYGKSDVWTALPERILAQKKKLMYSTSVLYAFLQSNNVEIDLDEYTLESAFIVQLKAFAALKFPRVMVTFTEEFYAYIFADYGLRVENTIKNWPPGSNNLQKQSYIVGCRVID